MKQPRHTGVLGIAFAALLGCSEATGPGPNTVAGTYILASVDGCILGTPVEQCPAARPPLAIGGTMVLRADGSVTRTVQYESEGAGPRTVVAVGTYTVKGGLVVFALRENAGASPYVWQPRALLRNGTLTLRYPHPADGEVMEDFRRQEQALKGYLGGEADLEGTAQLLFRQWRDEGWGPRLDLAPAGPT